MRVHTRGSRTTSWIGLFGLLAAIIWMPAWATSSFGYGAEPFEIQFVFGEVEPDFVGMIEVGMAHGPKSLPRGSYRITSYVYRKRLRLEFTNKGDPKLPPSFVLNVSGRKAVVNTGGKAFHGEFCWADNCE